MVAGLSVRQTWDLGCPVSRMLLRNVRHCPIVNTNISLAEERRRIVATLRSSDVGADFTDLLERVDPLLRQKAA